MRGRIRKIPGAPARSAVAVLEAAGWRVRVPFRGPDVPSCEPRRAGRW